MDVSDSWWRKIDMEGKEVQEKEESDLDIDKL
jgi:hypothetical protein